MGLLRLRDLRNKELHEFKLDLVRLGRNPEFEFVVSGQGSEVVSGGHSQFVYRQGTWWIEDLGGRNGTFVDGQRVVAERPLVVKKGQVVSLGQRGPKFEVDTAESDALAETLLEQPQAAPGDMTLPMDGEPPTGPRGAPPPPLRVAVVDQRSGAPLEAGAGRVRIGRGRECELRPVEVGDTSVSRVHCEIVLKPDGAVVLRDML